MGARIESAATARGKHRILAPSAERLSDRATHVCLDRARRRAEDVDLVVSAGIYGERSARPVPEAVARGGPGAGYDDRHRRHRPERAQAFEVPSGGCGALSAAYLVDGLVAGGTAKLGLVVAADVNPSPATSGVFPFAPVGGALILSLGSGKEGFDGFEFQSFPGDAPLFEATLEREGGALRGRYVLEVREDPRFAAACLAHARQVASGFLARAGLREADLDLLIASQYPPGFARDLARELGVAPDRVPRVGLDRSPAHSAGVMAALEAAIDSGQFWKSRTVLFVTAGAGISIGVALYRR